MYSTSLLYKDGNVYGKNSGGSMTKDFDIILIVFSMIVGIILFILGFFTLEEYRFGWISPYMDNGLMLLLFAYLVSRISKLELRKK